MLYTIYIHKFFVYTLIKLEKMVSIKNMKKKILNPILFNVKTKVRKRMWMRSSILIIHCMTKGL